MTDSLSRAEKLRIASAIAPSIRDAAHKGRKRPIKVVDHETGEVVREIDSLKLNEKLRERAGIEFGVEAGRRPQRVACADCGTFFTVKVMRGSHVARGVAICARCRNVPCVICGRDATPSSSKRSRSDGTRAYCSVHSPAKRSPATVSCGGCGKQLKGPKAARALRSGHRAYCGDSCRFEFGPQSCPCGNKFIAPTGGKRGVCNRCGSQSECAGVGGQCPDRAVATPIVLRVAAVRARKGGPWRCKSCSARIGNSERTQLASPCAVCGRPATRSSHHNAKHRGQRAYCRVHIHGSGGR